MFILGGRVLGTLAGLVCAGLVVVALGGCASSRPATAADLAERIDAGVMAGCPTGAAELCVSYGPRRDDVRCGCEDLHEAQAAFDRLTRH